MEKLACSSWVGLRKWVVMLRKEEGDSGLLYAFSGGEAHAVLVDRTIVQCASERRAGSLGL